VKHDRELPLFHVKRVDEPIAVSRETLTLDLFRFLHRAVEEPDARHADRARLPVPPGSGPKPALERLTCTDADV
jgi:hypothetical protein